MTNFRKMMIAAAATAMMVSYAQAAEVSSLAAGKPAGVKQAQGSPNPLIALGVGAVVAGGLAIALVSDDSKGECGAACAPPAATTTGTNP